MVRNDTESFYSLLKEGQLQQAAGWLVENHADEVVGLCTAMVRDRALAEDLAQDTFARAFSGLGGFRSESSPRTWLLRIAKNRCIDQLRLAKRAPWGHGGDAEDPDAQPDQTPLPSDLLDRREDVRTALEALAEGDRALIVLRFRNGLEYQELAMAFGLKEGTVRMRVSRALSRLREALQTRAAMDVMDAPVAGAAPAVLPDRRADDDVIESASVFRTPPPAAASRAPRGRAAPSRPPMRGLEPRRLRGALSRALGEPSLPAPPADHPLTAFFAATRSGPSRQLLESLRSAASQLH